MNNAVNMSLIYPGDKYPSSNICRDLRLHYLRQMVGVAMLRICTDGAIDRFAHGDHLALPKNHEPRRGI